MPDSIRRLLIVLTTLAALVLGVFLVDELRVRPYDREFDTRVDDPAVQGAQPVVLFDAGHRNGRSTRGAYRPLAELLRHDGYAVRTTRAPLSAETLKGAAVLVLAMARGANDANDDPACSEAEAAAVEAWVRGGGSLLLITDHWPYGSAVADLARRFEVSMGAGLVEAPTQHDPERGESHLIYSEVNGLLRDHPIVRGRKEAERVRRILTFTGQSVAGPAGAVPFLALPEDAVERPPGLPRVTRKGENVRVQMEYGAPQSAAGRAQGLALEVGAGRLVVLGEGGMLRAQRERGGGLVGMNVPGYDNRQLALNILHWLSRVL